MASNMIKNVLVPYDGSKFSKNAVKKAMEISDEKNSTIHLLSVVNVDFIQPPGSLLGMVSKSSMKSLKSLTQNAKAKTSKMLSEKVLLCKKNGFKADQTVTSGNISHEILKFAKKKKISLIVIGSQGLHGIGKIKALGSTSRKVSELASCPVLIVR